VQVIEAAYAALACARWERIGNQLEQMELPSLRLTERAAS